MLVDRHVGRDLSDERVVRRLLSSNAGVRKFESGELEVYNIGAAQDNHGLGQVPYGYSVDLKCVVSNLNYAVGETVPFPLWSGAHVLSVTATQIRITMFGTVGSRISLPNKSSGAVSFINEASWRLILKAWV